MFEGAKKWFKGEDAELEEMREQGTEKALAESYQEYLENAHRLLNQAKRLSTEMVDISNVRARNEFRDVIEQLKSAVSNLKANRAHIPDRDDPNLKEFHDYIANAERELQRP